MGLVYIGTNYQGNDAYLAETPAKWWGLWKQAVARDLPDIKLVIIQAAGSARASAGTHSDGWAVDLQTWHLTSGQIERLVAHARKYGASGTWYRTRAQGFDPHIHAALDPGSGWTNSAYQIEAVRDGYNGLGRGGRGGRDTHSAPARWITAAQGIALMEQEGEDDMVSTEQMHEIGKLAAKYTLAAEYGGPDDTVGKRISKLIEYGSESAYFSKQAAERVGVIYRPGDKRADENGNISLRQEIADTKTLALDNDARVKALDAKLDQILGLLEAQRG